ncbi:MAG TPA: NAD(P)-binding domain-containing protein [Candidatus Tumulicola sp.]|nr:NAD(P)-binding domain-containing protein [Candidatus Tumulicola sp.]
MKIGIIGSDPRAIAIGRLLASGGHELTVGDVRADAAGRAAAHIGAPVETPYQQAMTRDVLVMAFPRSEADRVLAAMGASPHGVIVDAREGGPARPHHGAELLAHKLDSHEVVRALVVLPQQGANIPICGDDPEAKAVVNEVFTACGCLTADRGPLSNAAELEPAGTDAA